MESQTNQASTFKGAQQPRIFTRVKHHAAIRYTDSTGHSSNALTLNIGWGGLGISLGRYLRPGTPIALTVPPRHTELPGIIVWCRPSENGSFLAGLRLALDKIEVLDALSALLLQAMLHHDTAQHAHDQGAPLSSAAHARAVLPPCICCVA